MKQLWHLFKDQELKLEFRKGKAKAWKLHKTLCEFVGKFIRVSYAFLLFVVGEEDPIGLFWLLYWCLPCVADIVTGGFRYCPILCL